MRLIINLPAFNEAEKIGETIRRIPRQIKGVEEVFVQVTDDGSKDDTVKISKEAGADFVKTSTGFSSAGATTADVSLMRQTVGPELGVKAAGGIHTRKDAEAMLSAGATRIGASAGIRIVQETPDDPKNQGAQGY